MEQLVRLSTKICPGCKETKSLDGFYISTKNKDGASYYCKPCNLIRTRNNDLIRLYGITMNDYNLMFVNQNGCCAICKKHQSEFKRTLAVDHNHETGKVRGLLCHACNNTLGLMKENIELLNYAIDYIERHK